MKPKFTSIIIVLLAAFIFSTAKAQTNTFPPNGAVGIGTTAPNPSSLLEVKSTTKGILIPRMTFVQRNAIVSPATGLMIYQTNSTPGFYYYGGGAWKALTPKAGWSLTGNAGTDSSINFLGTTDGHPLVFRVKNVKAGYIDYVGNNNTSFGYQGLLANTTGFYNTAVGYTSLKANISGGRNTAIGAYTLIANKADNNTAIGTYALNANNTGMNNAATGVNSLGSNTTGDHNSAYGVNTLYSNTSGVENTAIGVSALYANISGIHNTASGFAALNSNTADNNTATGAYALYLNTSGANNSAHGYEALYQNTTGSNNTANGLGALTFNSTGNNNTANGYKTLYSNTTGKLNTAIGVTSLYYNTTGWGNTATGLEALFFNTDGSYNTAIGIDASLSNTTGSQNTAIGNQALSSNQTGAFNTACGNHALDNNISSFNTAFGNGALHANTGGFGNTGLGSGADVSASNFHNATAIGSNAVVNSTNKIRLGDGNVTIVESAAGSWTTSDRRFKNNIKEEVKGLEFIKLLRPVVYNFDGKKFETHLLQNFPDSIKEKYIQQMGESAERLSHIKQTGFIAQEVEAAAKKIDYDFNGVHAPENPTDNWSLSYEKLVVPLVKAVQELSKMNDDKDEKINNLQEQINELKAAISKNNSGSAVIKDQRSISILSAALQQNIPNPFTNTTSISYTVPQKFTTAQIVITDKNGKTIKAVNVSGSGKGTIKVDASTLTSGAYQYSLMIDGKLIATKQMILAK